MNSPKEIGYVVRKLRGEMSLRDFAKMCNISHTTIDNIEKGIDFRTGKPTQVKMTTLEKIANACRVKVSYIIGEPTIKQIAPQRELIDINDANLDESTRKKLKEIEADAIVVNIRAEDGEKINSALLQNKQKPAGEGELSENVIIYHRDGKTVKRSFTKEQLALFHAMLDAIPEDPNDNKGL